MTKFSIITINYNNKKGLQKTIDSIISQTFNDYEWIIIDGGSTDGSKELIEQHSEYITYWVSEPDKGIYNAMNKGISKSAGQFLNFMNSGDEYFCKFTLESVYKILNKVEADIFYGNSLYIYKDKQKTFYTPKELNLYHIYTGTILHQASFIKRTLLSNNGYDESLKIVSDWKMWLIWILQNKVFQHIDLTVSKFDAYGISTTNEKLVQKERKIVLNTILPSTVRDVLDELDRYKQTNKVYPHLNILISFFKKNDFYLKCINKVIRFFQIIDCINKK